MFLLYSSINYPQMFWIYEWHTLGIWDSATVIAFLWRKYAVADESKSLCTKIFYSRSRDAWLFVGCLLITLF